MTKSEETYAAWMNVLGSDPLPDGPVEKSARMLRILAEVSGDIDRLSSAYMAVLAALAVSPKVREGQARELTETLVEAARAHHVQYTAGLPLLIEGLDCSPEHIRQLTAERDRYRNLYVNGGAGA